MSLLLCFCLLFSVASLNASASSDGFSTYDMSYKGVAVLIDSDGKTQQVDCTSTTTKTSTIYNSVDCTVYGMGNSPGYVAKSIIAHEITDLNTGHEYNINFQYNSSLPSSTVFVCDLVFYGADGTELKRQTLYEDFKMSSGWHTVDVDFKPDNTGLNSGYKSKIEFTFTNTSTVLVYFRLSDTVQLTDKDDNSNWFQKIINAIKEIPVKLGNLGDNIGNWFSNLGDNIGGFFDGLWEKLSNAFSNIRVWFLELGDKISTKFQEISDNFTAFFEKFKPRVYVNFNWRRGQINSNTGAFAGLDNDKIPQVIVSDFFVVQASDKYLLDVSRPSSGQYAFRIFKYDLDGNYLSFENVKPTTEYPLDSGFQYRFQFALPRTEPENTANDYVLVYADEGWLSAFGHYLLNGLKSLFIPSDGYFDAYMEKTKTWASERFGFLYTAGDLVVSFITNIRDMLKDDFQFVLPAAEFDLNGDHYVLWNEYTVPMSEYLENKTIKFIYSSYCFILGGICSFALLNYAIKVFDKILAN